MSEVITDIWSPLSVSHVALTPPVLCRRCLRSGTCIPSTLLPEVHGLAKPECIMSQEPALDIGINSILLTLVASLYYFTLQPWTILARTTIIVLSFAFSRTAAEQATPSAMEAVSATLVEGIEFKTKHTVTIEATLDDQTLEKCHPQQQSPLFYKLPKELRDCIFELSCTQSPDERHTYEANSFYHRPGHTARLKTHTSLLHTCRRIWLEAHALPMRQAEHAFWFQRGPYDRNPDHSWQGNVRNERDRYGRFLKSLTSRNLRNVTHIHLFMQMFQAEQLVHGKRMTDFLPRHRVEGGFRPKRFTITFRSSDWADWESGRPMSLPAGWVQKILDSPFLGAVEEFVLELETSEGRKDQLDAIVQQIRRLEGTPKLVDLTGQDQSRACKFVPKGHPMSMRWSRSPQINNKDHMAYSGIATLQLVATTLVWRNTFCGVTDATLQTAYSHEARNPIPVHLDAYHRIALHAPQHIALHAMAQRSRALRLRLRTEGWSSIGKFPEDEDEMHYASVRAAGKWEEVQRQRIEKMFGDIEAKRLLSVWEENGSLLKFMKPGT